MTYRFNRPCLDCGKLSRGTRCEEHQAIIDRRKEATRPDAAQRRAKKKQYYNSDYQRRARHVRQTAEVCHLCGEGARPGDPWQADHLEPGNPASPLLPAHRSCNAKRGNKPLAANRPQHRVPPPSIPGAG